MKRRNFLKSVVSGTVAGMAAPLEPMLTREPHYKTASVAPNRSEGTKEIYQASDRVRSGLALGGIGAGTFELRKDGRFYNWNIFNNFPKETGPEFRLPEGEIEDPQAANLFFTVRYQVEGQEPKIRLLQISDGLYEGGEMDIAYLFPWMRAVDQIEYSARYPFSTLTFSADGMPFEIRMQAWSPFIPHDVKNSALPLAYFDFTITPKTAKRVDVLLIMSAMNNVGYETPDRFYTTEIQTKSNAKIISMSCGGMDERASSFGQIALTSFAADSTYYCGWGHRHPYMEYVLRHADLPNLDDTLGTSKMTGTLPEWLPRTQGRNRIDPQTGKVVIHDTRLLCSVAKSFRLEGSTSVAHTFAYTWNFPNLYAEKEFRERGDRIEGHYYSNFFDSASAVAVYAVANRADLHRKSRKFLDDFFNSSADVFVLEQINSHLNTFATSGRLVKSGDFGILEGLSATWSWGPIGTIDVMLYGTVPIIALFPELQKSTMRCHRRSQSPEGEIAHGIEKDFRQGEDGTAGVSHRLDLPGQYVILVMRDFFWTNDLEYLREMYPSIQRAIEYVIKHRSFPGSHIPLMKGIESSYDNFPMYGYASYVLSQWLCAIACAAQAADKLGDKAGKVLYDKILEETRTAMQTQLWNGSFYSLYNDRGNAAAHGDRSEGCLTDQLVGQWSAHLSGIGYLVERDSVISSLRAILAQSYRSDFGLRNCSWPGNRYFADVDRDIWVDQANTCWSGVELAFASFLMYEGMYKEALQVVETVDRRYRDSCLYFDHLEFGGHYFRPMAAWGILHGMLGLGINQDHLSFNPSFPGTSYRLFFATPAGTAHFIRTEDNIEIVCLSGTLNLSTLTIKGSFNGSAMLQDGQGRTALRPSATNVEGSTNWTFPTTLQLKEGQTLHLA